MKSNGVQYFFLSRTGDIKILGKDGAKNIIFVRPSTASPQKPIRSGREKHTTVRGLSKLFTEKKLGSIE